MSRTRMFVFFQLLLFFCAAALSHARSFETVRASGVLRAATEGAYAPFNYFEGKTLKGFEVDLVDAIAKDLGLRVEWTAQAFDSLLVGLASDRFDLVAAAHTVTPERAKSVLFLNPHACAGAMIVSLKKSPLLHASDLRGKTIAVQVGTTYAEDLKPHAPKAVKFFPKDTDAAMALKTGKVDVWISSRVTAARAIKALGAEVFQMGDLLVPERIGMAVTLGNTALAEPLNKSLQTLLKNGTYSKLSQTAFESDLRCPSAPR